ncbi:MAG: hypothetical protein AB1641_12365 [Thermodesulfobacteriota bacterium]
MLEGKVYLPGRELRLLALAAWLVLCPSGQEAGWAWSGPPVPEYLAGKGLKPDAAPIEIADAFLGAPYREDGTLDENGRFTLFEHPDRVFPTPGLNCSGLVLAISRFLLGRNFTLAESQRDRLGDSGPDSPLGRNWDYGWDLILNLTDHASRRVIMPDGHDRTLESATALTMRGFDLQDGSAWPAVLRRIKPENTYLATFSRPSGRVKAGIVHHHVAVLLADGRDGVWMYQTTHTSTRVIRFNLNSAPGLALFRESFRPIGGGRIMLLIIEAAAGRSVPVRRGRAGFRPSPAGSGWTIPEETESNGE